MGLSLHQKTDLSMSDTTIQLIVHRRWLRPCHKSRGECWTFCQQIATLEQQQLNVRHSNLKIDVSFECK